MLEAYKNFWLGYLDFYGRTKRSDYWWVVLINGVIGTLIFLLMNLLGQTKAAGFTLTAFILFITATALPTISIQIRRLRDASNMFTPLNNMLPVYYIKKIGARCENLDFLSFIHI